MRTTSTAPAPVRTAPAAPAKSRRYAIALWICGPLVVFALACIGLWMIVPTLSVALWWPAGGGAALFALIVPRRQRSVAYSLILGALAAAILLSGASPLQAFLYALASTVEAIALVTLLTLRRTDFRLRSLSDGVRLIVIIAIVAIAYGLVIGMAAGMTGEADFLYSAAVATGSHAAAMLMIVPLAIIPPRMHRATPWLEIGVQTTLMALAVAVAFNPASTLPLSFLVFAVLAWSVLRFPPAVAYFQTLLLGAAIVTLARVDGAGLFPSDLPPTDLALTTVTFLCTIGIVTVAVVSTRYEDTVSQTAALAAARAITDAERETTEALRLRHELDRQREDFVATTSHELRTPITIITGYASLLSDTELPATSREWVTAINRNIARLSLLLSNLLSLAHPRDEPNPRPTHTPASDLIAGALAPLRDAIDDNKLLVTMSAPADLAVFADRDDAKRIIRSLISNAVKFSPAGCSVHVSAKRVDQSIVFSVVDNGPGMSAEDVEHIFEPFYRGAHASTHATAGAGLGLPVARMLTRRNHGELSIVSHLGQGARAELRLAASHLDAADCPTAPEEKAP